MAHKTENRCKVCTSPYRLEIEELRVKYNKTFQDTANIINEKYGTDFNAQGIHRHMSHHFDIVNDDKNLLQIASRKLFKETLVDSNTRAAKLSGMIQAAYEYVSTHYDELDMDSALKMLFGSIDQLNKMEGTGVFAGNDFMMKFQEMLDSIKRGTVTQPALVFEVDETGESRPADNPVETVDNSNDALLKKQTSQAQNDRA